ncbi:carbohydrate ABC transporter permease [Cellulomonas timonensis]|uniref:carbohydrate ABC transporter permease n=1 Tax=Cellulomonas timonensis TaxID=1689271 RepID=UPI00082C3271|nr:carbohydrate ABC transporter permease [Cellulomonas timonensis]
MSAITAPAPAPAVAPADPQRPRARRRRVVWRIHGPLSLYMLFTLLPFYWMVMFAFRERGSSSLLPKPFTTENLKYVWVNGNFSQFFLNSMIVAVLAVVVSTIIAVMCGYALSRYSFRGKNAFQLLMLSTQFIPGAMMLIPLFKIFQGMGLMNSLWALVIADTVFHLPLSMLLMAGFIKNIPISLEEAAWVDGCSRFAGFRRVIFPLLVPGMVAVGAYAFIGAWNNFLFAVMFINEQSKFTVPVGLSYMLGEFGVDYGSLAAGGLIAVLPVILLFAYVQKYLVTGLSAGAVKG